MPSGTYKLTQREVDELRRLRAEDPKTWTNRALGKKFGISHVSVIQILKFRHRVVRDIDLNDPSVQVGDNFTEAGKAMLKPKQKTDWRKKYND
jgi:hypothetical protein